MYGFRSMLENIMRLDSLGSEADVDADDDDTDVDVHYRATPSSSSCFCCSPSPSLSAARLRGGRLRSFCPHDVAAAVVPGRRPSSTLLTSPYCRPASPSSDDDEVDVPFVSAVSFYDLEPGLLFADAAAAAAAGRSPSPPSSEDDVDVVGVRVRRECFRAGGGDVPCRSVRHDCRPDSGGYCFGVGRRCRERSNSFHRQFFLGGDLAATPAGRVPYLRTLSVSTPSLCLLEPAAPAAGRFDFWAYDRAHDAMMRERYGHYMDIATGPGGSGGVAIDNKIEQAMDLVKSHLMYAVREEVEVLKEKITELVDRISELEYENGILRAHANSETLALVQTAKSVRMSSGPGPANNGIALQQQQIQQQMASASAAVAAAMSMVGIDVQQHQQPQPQQQFQQQQQQHQQQMMSPTAGNKVLVQQTQMAPPQQQPQAAPAVAQTHPSQQLSVAAVAAAAQAAQAAAAASSGVQ